MTSGPQMYSWRSVPQLPPQWTSTVTSSGPGGGGEGMVSMRMSDLAWKRAAFIVIVLVFMLIVLGAHRMSLGLIM